MKALAVTPGKGDLRMIEVDEPVIKNNFDVKLRVIQVGICGTDREETTGGRSDAPEGDNFLIIGHEMFGQVVETGSSVTRVKKGDYAMFIVRHPCDHCIPCSNDRSDMCLTGDYKECGIKGLHGFQKEYVVDNEKYLIHIPDEISDIGVLIEPMSVVEKAIDEALQLQATRIPGFDKLTWLQGKKALVAGIGPIGLLAAFILRIKGANIFGLDIVEESSARPSILKELGGHYINGNEIKTISIDDEFGDMDFILEATGIASLEFQLMDALGRNGIYVLTGIPAGERPVTFFGAELMRNMVLMNQVMFGSVNAGIKHYIQAVDDLKKIKKMWGNAILKVITERTSHLNFEEAFKSHSSDEIKTLIEWV